MSGTQGRDRTADTAIFSRMLYQLSYLGIYWYRLLVTIQLLECHKLACYH